MILSVTFLAWHSQSLVSWDTSARRCCYSSSLKSSISSFRVRNCLDWFRVPVIACLGGSYIIFPLAEFFTEWLLCRYRFDPKTGLLYPSIAVFEKPPSLLTNIILRIFAALHLVKLTYGPDRRNIKSTTNLTILCMVLCLFGPMKEPNLTKSIMAIQAAGSVLAFVIRYAGAGLFYESTRR